MTDYRKVAYTLLSELTGDRNVITIPKMLVKMTGDMNSAAVLNQVLYWSDRTKSPDGWFFKTYPEWEDETGLSQYEIKRAIAGDKRRKEKTGSLQDFGVQTERRKHGRGVKLFYRIDRDVFMHKVVEFANMNNVDNRQRSQSKNMNNVDIPYTEITTETTEKDSASPTGNAQTVLQTDAALYGESVIEEQDLIPVAAAQQEAKPKKERPANPWYDAVKDTMGVEGFKNGHIVNALRSTGKGVYAKYNLDTPLTDPEQVRTFWAWFQTKCVGCSLASPATAQDWVMRWQTAGCPNVSKRANEVLEDDIEWVLPSERPVIQYVDKPA